MLIGIIGALAIEVEEIIGKMENAKKETVSRIDFYLGTISGVNCVVARCGVGKVNAALCAQTMILRYAPDMLLNSGVAGGIKKGIRIGDLVLASCTVQHDVDTTPFGDPAGLVPEIDMVEMPTSHQINLALADAAKACGFPGAVHEGCIASGDQFICSTEKLHWIASTFGADACEMESGSIAQVCYINGVAYTALRCISDNADDSADADYEQFSEYAAHQTTELLCRALPELAKLA